MKIQCLVLRGWPLPKRRQYNHKPNDGSRTAVHLYSETMVYVSWSRKGLFNGPMGNDGRGLTSIALYIYQNLPTTTVTFICLLDGFIDEKQHAQWEAPGVAGLRR